MTLWLIRSNYIFLKKKLMDVWFTFPTNFNFKFIEEKIGKVKRFEFIIFFIYILIYGSVTKTFQNWYKAARGFQHCFKFIFFLSTLFNVTLRICILLTASLENLHAIRTHTHLNAHTKTHIYTHITHSKQELLP